MDIGYNVLTESSVHMDGIINLYKPRGISSAKALYRVRKITGQRKSGHAGTLDPAAEGVLLLCMGKGTKLVERLMDAAKVYRTLVRLDITSDSFDCDEPVRPVAVDVRPTGEQIREVLASMEGTISQVPPALSALKVGGRPAYRLSRAGKPPKLAARTVRIYWIHMHSYDWPIVDIEVACGRGTYVRSIVRDIGVQLQTGGCLTRLVRSAVGPFVASDAVKLDELSDMEQRSAALTPLERCVQLLSHAQPSVPERPT